MIPEATELQNEVYRAGRNARTHVSAKNVTPPKNLTWEERHWWLAGFHDRDIEIRGPKTPARMVHRGKS